jgi:hypothetical protein
MMLALLRRCSIGLMVAGFCVALTSATAAMALRRPLLDRLDTATASRLRADYSADARDETMAPMDWGVIQAAAVDAAAAGGEASPVAAGTDVPGSSAGPSLSTPTPGPSVVGTPAATPRGKPSPQPTKEPKPTSTHPAGPIVTEEPAPTETEVREPTVTEEPAPTKTTLPEEPTKTEVQQPEPTETPAPTERPGGGPTRTPVSQAKTPQGGGPAANDG